MANARSMSLRTACASRRTVAPSRRFSRTVSAAKMCRPSGTRATPRPTTSSSAIPVSGAPANVTWPASGATIPAMAESSEVLPAPFGTDNADGLAFRDFEIYAAHRRHRAVAHGQSGNGEQGTDGAHCRVSPPK